MKKMFKQINFLMFIFLFNMSSVDASFLPTAETSEEKELSKLYQVSFYSIEKETAIFTEMPNTSQKIAIGNFDFDDETNECVLCFRGALGLGELMNTITNSEAIPVKGIKINGKVHKGTQILFDGILKNGLGDKIVEHLANSGKSFSDYKTTVQGYSVGAGLSYMVSQWLTEEMSAKNVSLYTYAPISFCDETAKSSFERNGQIVSKNYRMKEDLISSFFDKTFSFPGVMTSLNAEDSPSYIKNVKAGEFPHLESSMLGFATSGMANFIFGGKPFDKIWNAHMLDTFTDHSAFKKSSKNKISEK